jgi:NAD(P)-dependent dehydrogenase (short-subunit alcohol dehydrogenase family)
MHGKKKGCIINLSSVAGHKALPGTSVYVASKHAVEGLTKVAALEAAPFNVRVNTGVPFRRARTSEEVAQTIVFLASDQASFITGQVLSIDGGIFAQS